MMNDTKRNLLLIVVLAIVVFAMIGGIIWRNAYGRRERVRVFLMNATPNLGKPELWEIEQYSEDRTTEWRVRKFKTSGVIKCNQTLYSLKHMYEQRKGEPLSFTIYHFVTLKEMSEGVSFEVDFDTESSFARHTNISFPIPKFYTVKDLKDLCRSGVVVVDDDIMVESLPQSKDIANFIVQLTAQLRIFENEFVELERFLSGDDDTFDTPGDELLRQATQKERDINARLAILTVINKVCKDNPALHVYSVKSLEYLVKYQSLLSRLTEFKTSIPARRSRRPSVAVAPTVTKDEREQPQRADDQITPQPPPSNVRLTVSPAAPPRPRKLPTMMPTADLRTVEWAKLHRPELFARYEACLQECDKKQDHDLAAAAILKYNDTYRQLISEKREYDANPVKKKDLDPEVLEFAESECPEYHQEYLKAKRSIRNRRIIYNKARNDGASKERLNQLQSEINGAIVKFNDARQHIINSQQTKK